MSKLSAYFSLINNMADNLQSRTSKGTIGLDSLDTANTKLIVNSDSIPDRITLSYIKEKYGEDSFEHRLIQLMINSRNGYM